MKKNKKNSEISLMNLKHAFFLKEGRLDFYYKNKDKEVFIQSFEAPQIICGFESKEISNLSFYLYGETQYEIEVLDKKIFLELQDKMNVFSNLEFWLKSISSLVQFDSLYSQVISDDKKQVFLLPKDSFFLKSNKAVYTDNASFKLPNLFSDVLNLVEADYFFIKGMQFVSNISCVLTFKDYDLKNSFDGIVNSIIKYNDLIFKTFFNILNNQQKLSKRDASLEYKRSFKPLKDIGVKNNLIFKLPFSKEIQDYNLFDILEFNNVKFSEIELSSHWWLFKTESYLGFIHENNQPVSLIYHPVNGYEIRDPVFKKRLKINSLFNSQLSKKGIQIHNLKNKLKFKNKIEFIFFSFFFVFNFIFAYELILSMLNSILFDNTASIVFILMISLNLYLISFSFNSLAVIVSNFLFDFKFKNSLLKLSFSLNNGQKYIENLKHNFCKESCYVFSHFLLFVCFFSVFFTHRYFNLYLVNNDLDQFIIGVISFTGMGLYLLLFNKSLYFLIQKFKPFDFSNKSIDDHSNLTLDNFKESLEFRHLKFYKEQDQELNIYLNKGELLALSPILSTNSSRILKQILGKISFEHGFLLIDSMNINLINKFYLNKYVSIVCQDTIIESGCIRDVLKSFSESSDIEIWNLLRLFKCDYEIQLLTNGLDSNFEMNALNFSSSLNIRFLIIQALLEKKPIFLYDEIYHPLEKENCDILIDYLKKYNYTAVFTTKNQYLLDKIEKQIHL